MATNGKSNAGWWILGILVLLGIIYWLYTIGTFNKFVARFGGTPVINDPGEESHCNDTDENGNRITNALAKSSGCLPPQNTALYLVVEGKVKEREWQKETLESLIGELPTVDTQRPAPSIKLGGYRNNDENSPYYNQYIGGTTWTFNQIRGGDLRNDGTRNPTYYLYVDNTNYPNIHNL